ncbi:MULTISPECIES: TetR/AcrR family transcriptional regulator [Dactylosporangium]|uniref:TetR family transcriptional regulator n=2 Tax=Dactylosporangium TaxID=35753 RepID=A0A9W6KFD1_9ACTN|nr:MULTISPECIES: TetR family transcriptional regulator [Dactylosporangium]UAB94168.1 TetR/AcrR family transcriptional regulator [Dactylosporangium vinaceum]UWZ42576.1 TetR/AcrR family transcriptional regulator [Dactylosporangium matsuzakiense]GLL00503.1 TetR family transcriptional regulator [Dactylosporangium matsuzakiense]
MTATPARRRDAAKTRALLLQTARRRFAQHGYSTTTLRDIADEAGVNVALIARYFESKEGLFEACLTAAVDEIKRETGDVPLSEIHLIIADQASRIGSQDPPSQLMLLLRSSGDERADEIRRGVLRTSAERLAAAAGHRPGDDETLLRAQMVLAASLGIVLLRSVGAMEPLQSAGRDDLAGPLRDLIAALLPARP